MITSAVITAVLLATVVFGAVTLGAVPFGAVALTFAVRTLPAASHTDPHHSPRTLITVDALEQP